MNSSKLSYRAEIDGLRAIAVISVIFYHAQIVLFDRDWFEGGFIGVDIFFVISGYLITRIILSEFQSNGSFSFLNFYERRARRILPMLFLVIFVSFPFAWQTLLPSAFMEYEKSLLSSVFFGSNFFFYFSTSDYGAESALLKPFLHTWSLSVEEQFYLVFPIIAIIAFKYYRAHFLMIIIGLALLSLLFAELMEVRNPDLNFYFPFSRFWELAVGSMLAYKELNYKLSDDSFLNRVMPIIGLHLVVYSILYFDGKTPHPGLHTIIPIFGAALIIGFATKDELVGKVLGSKPFVWIGLISYSAYLWHFPIFAIVRYELFSFSDTLALQLIIFIFSLSVLSYLLVEKPFRNKNKVSGKKFIIFLISSVFFVFALQLIEKRELLFNAENVSAKEFSNATKVKVNERGVLLPSKIAFELNEKPVILVLGDSFIISDDYPNQFIKTGNWTSSLDRFDTKKYEIIYVSYTLCDIEVFSDKLKLIKVKREKNINDCHSFVDVLNNEPIRKKLHKVVLVSHRPYQQHPHKFDFLRYLIRNSDIKQDDIFVIGNYLNLRYKTDPTCELIMEKSDNNSAINCIEYILENNFLEFKISNGSKIYYPKDLSIIKYVDLFQVLFGEYANNLDPENLKEIAPYQSNGVPFIFDTHHNTNEFILFILDKIQNYNGNDLNVVSFKSLLK